MFGSVFVQHAVPKHTTSISGVVFLFVSKSLYWFDFVRLNNEVINLRTGKGIAKKNRPLIIDYCFLIK